MQNNSAKINIAVDGHSSCGKSTIAKAIAKELSYTYIDSGAMYRAVTSYVLDHGIDVFDWDAVAAVLPDIKIHFEHGPDNGIQTFLNGQSVEDVIRGMEVSNNVSHIAVIPAVRRAMVHQQQAIGQDKGVVMDGRDIGTVVFPDAELKVFLTASMEARVKRRYLQLQQSGKSADAAAIRKNLFTRDYIDSTRSDSPLTKTPGAILIDNTYLTEAEQLKMVLALVHYRLEKQ